jgi:hypothetical protein
MEVEDDSINLNFIVLSNINKRTIFATFNTLRWQRII